MLDGRNLRTPFALGGKEMNEKRKQLLPILGLLILSQKHQRGAKVKKIVVCEQNLGQFVGYLRNENTGLHIYQYKSKRSTLLGK